ncbi:WXG100 family type VII secretion target [Rhodococcus sp. NPDC049939]|uniref:WXG100 family type VII secretion target n=1 Tax=Rhodococcus sp. NPDC049939 TaxID=3155511 RepID=UPI0033DA041E
MGNLETDVQQMEAAVNHVETVNSQLQGAISRLKTRCDESAASWQGGAQKAFMDLMVRYGDASSRMHASLDEIAMKIRENKKGYDATEQANQDAIHAAGASGSLNL